MVLNREVKEDVFANFEIDLEVKDNSEKKMKEVYDVQTKGPTQFVGGRVAPKEDVFAQFNMNEKEQQRQVTEDEKAKAAATGPPSPPGPPRKNLRQMSDGGKSSRHGSDGGWNSRHGSEGRGRRRSISSNFLGRSQSNLDVRIQSERPALINERISNNGKWQSERAVDWGTDQKQKRILPRVQSERFFIEQNDSNDEGKFHRTRQASNLHALYEEDHNFHDNDLPTQITVTEDTRDRASYETQSSRMTSAGSGLGAATEGTVPQGAAPLTAGEELMDEIFRLDKPGYDVFADFDLDGIVRDYETTQRKVNYAPGKDKAHKDGETDETELYAAVYRYRNLKQMWLDNFPRSHGIIFRILIPLWILVAISLLLGYILALYEQESEYQANDEVMVNRFLFQQLPYKETINFMSVLPTACFEFYTFLKRKETNSTIPPSLRELKNLFGEDLPEITPLNNSADVDVEELADEIAAFMRACEDIGTDLVSQRINYTETKAALEAATGTPLSFDWIRCWDMDVYGGVNPVFPSQQQVQAANNQSEFYAAMWELDRIELFNFYMEKYECADVICEEKALNQSIHEATGSGMCGTNNGGSAWFWFIVMTTVGYGNQSPITMEGRALVAGLGWLLIIAWAVNWIVAGKVVGIILDDIFRKIRLRFMTGQWVGAVFFGFLGFSWMVLMGWAGLVWWNKNIEDHDKSLSDSLWWSYISLLSVGLGDYFMEPEVFFYKDNAIWSFMFLTGFTFLSTFLDKIAILSEGYFPDSGEALKERIRNTNLIGQMTIEFKQKNEAALEDLGALVKKMDDEDMKQMMQRVTRIRAKKEILIRLLYQTEQELDHFTQRGEQYEDPALPRVCVEENMLEEVLEKTRREREKLSRYRDGVPKPSKEQSDTS